MTKYLGVEAVVDAMMYHLGIEEIQENGAAVIANIASVDLGAKRQHEVNYGSKVADTQATRNLIDALIPIGKAIKRFPRLPSPRFALHVLVANLGSPKEALEAGCGSIGCRRSCSGRRTRARSCERRATFSNQRGAPGCGRGTVGMGR